MARPDNPTSVYLDSNTLIYAITKKPSYEPVAAVLRLAEASKIVVVISNFTYVGVFGEICRRQGDDRSPQSGLGLTGAGRVAAEPGHSCRRS
ncbi:MULTISPECIES: hypothetical protein [Micromonospora]|uniref:PIN domain-containing protein n=1 Tax=Micromonospora yangpuensis TaxID=683228 RepID=A0A1C6TXW5_9ACTN|nr:hypothetical protein [Micromonospora yangpuensis]GGM20019.1 hypothetical protein GCM10012279_42940 [Micromonospora yangpuensis]SCL46645.1 hypothetical protein GA0070617_0340 [Micromonospora yangpuensis]